MSKALKRVCSAVQRLYPQELADSSWDNTGLLLDSSLPGDQPLKVLLTVDLTSSVCTEAIEQKCNVIIAYHPFIFRGLKSITPKDPQQASLLKLVRAGISVYCPHTAVDAAKGGVNDWLADLISNGNEKRREFLQPVSHPTHEAGMGRYVELEQPKSIAELVQNVKTGLGLSTVQLVAPSDRPQISSIAICAGSGGSVVRGSKADLVFTGELGHHEMLHLRESGKSAIVCGHSNTERGFLKVLRKQLLAELDDDAEISIAETDRDPIEYV